MIKKYLNKIILIIAVTIGGFLRLNSLSVSPPSLNWDEAALGYNAYSISITGKDEYGKLLPVFTRSFDEYKSTLPIYLMIPAIKIFGLNEIGVRFPSALLGTFSILLIYVLTKKLLRDERIASLTSFVFAIEPWSVHFSRVYHEANIALFFLMLGLIMYFYAKKYPKFLPLSVFSFMLSMYTYNSNKIFIPLLLIGLYIVNKNELQGISRKIKYYTGGILIFFITVFIHLALKGEAFARVMSTNIFSFWPVTGVLKSLIETHEIGEAGGFLLHNRYYYFLWEVMGRFISYFSPANLFLREPQEPVTIVAGNSIFYPFEFIPWLIGIYWFVNNIKNQKTVLLITLLSPIPAIVTWNWFQPGRVMSLFMIFCIFIGVGVNKIIESLSKILKSKLYFAYSLLFLNSAVIFYGLVNAFYLYDSINVFLPFRDSGSYQPGFRETVPAVMKLSERYDRVIIESQHAQPYIFYLFYGGYTPKKYLGEIDPVKIGTPRKYYDFGKFHFRKIYWPDDRNLVKTLFVGNDQNLPDKDIDQGNNISLKENIVNSRGDILSKIVGTK